MEIDSIIGNAASRIAGAIRDAARSTGASFEYLLTTARIESNLNPTAQATTSSAKGLYQFIEQTWLGTMKQAGPAFGYGQYADAISQGPDGHYQVSDPSMYRAIMRLRGDPAASAMMAGAFTRANGAQLAGAIGRQPSEGELYIAHFLGPDGAAKLINAATSQPQASAATLFPQAAAANRSIFYDSVGSARSTAQVYGKLTDRYEFARARAFTPRLLEVADLPDVPRPPASIPAPPVADNAGVTKSFVQTNGVRPPAARSTPPVADTAGVTQAFAQANEGRPPGPVTRPLFQSMFSDRPNRAVTQTVSALWTPAGGAMPTASAPAQALDLFTDIKPGTRKLIGGGA